MRCIHYPTPLPLDLHTEVDVIVDYSELFTKSPDLSIDGRRRHHAGTRHRGVVAHPTRAKKIAGVVSGKQASHMIWFSEVEDDTHVLRLFVRIKKLRADNTDVRLLEVFEKSLDPRWGKNLD